MTRIRPRGSYTPHAVDLIDHSQVQRPPFFLHQHEEEEESRTGHDGFDGPWRTTVDTRSSKANRINNRSKELFNLEKQPILKSSFSKKVDFSFKPSNCRTTADLIVEMHGLAVRAFESLSESEWMSELWQFCWNWYWNHIKFSLQQFKYLRNHGVENQIIKFY